MGRAWTRVGEGEWGGRAGTQTVEHCGHENIVTGAVHERDVPHQLVAPFSLLDNVFRGASARQEVSWARALGVLALIDLCIRIAELDGDVALELILKADGLHHRRGYSSSGTMRGKQASLHARQISP